MKKGKYVISILMITLLITSSISLHAKSNSDTTANNDFYEEKGQYSLEKMSDDTFNTSNLNTVYKEKDRGLRNQTQNFQDFIDVNPEIKHEIEENLKKGLELTEIAYTKVYLKEIPDGKGGYNYQPVTNSELKGRSDVTNYHNLTISLQYYADSWNRGNATINQQAVWKISGGGISGAESSNDDYMALTVAANHSIISHGMYGVATNTAMNQRSGNGVSYRFRENKGSQTLTTNTSYTNFSGQRLFVGSYVHTWASANVSFGFTLTGPTVSISGTSSAWDIACDLQKYSD